MTFLLLFAILCELYGSLSQATMQLQRYHSTWKINAPGSVVTIGNFDGVHLGHQYVLEKTVQTAKRLNLPAVVLTFEPLPREFFQPTNAPSRLTRLREKLPLFAAVGIDLVVVVRFNTNFSELTPEAFIKTILVKSLQTQHIIIGEDFRFGQKRLGNTALLTQLGKTHHFATKVLADFALTDSQRISSTLIRQALKEADFNLASKLLGRPYHLSGRVCHGDKLGRTFGFPTANVYLHRSKSPLIGIYAVLIYGIGEKPLHGAAYIGSRPSVGGTRVLLEVFLLDFEEDIYGRYIEVEPLAKIRDDEHFESFDALKAQINRDVMAVKQYFSIHTGV